VDDDQKQSRLMRSGNCWEEAQKIYLRDIYWTIWYHWAIHYWYLKGQETQIAVIRSKSDRFNDFTEMLNDNEDEDVVERSSHSGIEIIAFKSNSVCLCQRRWSVLHEIGGQYLTRNSRTNEQIILLRHMLLHVI
jgi:hypothetical protein